jgi:hypothetical protein
MLVPVVGQLQQRGLGVAGFLDVVGGRQEDQGEAPLLVLDPADLHEPELVAEEIQRLLEVGHSHHRMKVFHDRLPLFGLGDGASAGEFKARLALGRKKPWIGSRRSAC